MYSFDFVVDTADVDSSGSMRLSNLFLYMQRVAMEDADAREVGYYNLVPLNMMWVITRYGIKINRLPRFEEKITVTTYPGDTFIYFYPRHFVFKDANGNVLLKASSIWTILDKNTRKVVGQTDKVKKIVGEKTDDELPLPQKITPKEVKLLEKRVVRYSDVDLNGHLNNTRYIAMINDLKDSSFYKNKTIKDFSINYLHEIKEGDEVELYSDNGFTYVEAKVNGTMMFNASLKFD